MKPYVLSSGSPAKGPHVLVCSVEDTIETMRQALSGGHVEDEAARRALVSGVATIGDSVSALRKERS